MTFLNFDFPPTSHISQTNKDSQSVKSLWKLKLITTRPVYVSSPHYYKQSLKSAQKKILSEGKKVRIK